MTLTSTYDHRVIQGAQSGEFLKRIHALLLGEDGFYDEIFRALRIPYEPIRWTQRHRDVARRRDQQAGPDPRADPRLPRARPPDGRHRPAGVPPAQPPRPRDRVHGLTLWDLDREFAAGSFGGEGRRFMKLRNILGILRDSYCRTTGIEYMHIMDPEQRRWIQERVERPHTKPPRQEQLRILLKLNQAEAFETFLQTKFVGQKRFSLEGGETTIPLIDEICEAAAETGLDEVTIGMAHRGRLNVLANIVGKKYSQIFREFEGNIDPRTVQGSGDVKYHLGAEGEFLSGLGDRIKVSVAANPSHLEAVDPVLEGIARAKQDVLNRGAEYPVLPLLVHGDAAFAGQGVVAARRRVRHDRNRRRRRDRRLRLAVAWPAREAYTLHRIHPASTLYVVSTLLPRCPLRRALRPPSRRQLSDRRRARSVPEAAGRNTTVAPGTASSRWARTATATRSSRRTRARTAGDEVGHGLAASICMQAEPRSGTSCSTRREAQEAR